MKLVQIEHLGRSFRVVATTLLWAPDKLSLTQFRNDLASAQAAYTAALVAAAEFAGPRPNIGGRLDGWVTASPNQADELTLGQIRAQARADQAAYLAWEERRQAAMRPFSSFMVERGYAVFGQPTPALKATVLWGRNWDQSLPAEQTVDPGRDLPGSLREREIKVPVPEEDAIWAGAYTLETEEYVTADPTEASKPVLPRDPNDF